MKKRLIYVVAMLAGMAVFTTCKRTFLPAATDQNVNLLVIDGLINSGTDSTIIRLSRTVKVNTGLVYGTVPNPELKAVVTVEDDQNKIYLLKETSKGYYVSAGLNLDAARNYHLRVKTTDGQVYLSDYEPVKVSPPIDSLGFTTTATGLTVYANTHDATNNTHYYRWEYEETWIFDAQYDHSYLSITPPDKLVLRAQNLFQCFAADTSRDVVLNSTTQLAQDVLYHAPITLIPGSSEKIGIRYSILVKQYALSKGAYEFWTSIKKNSENVGSIFDAQPANAPGNIHCISDASRLALGYVGVGAIQRKRIFIDKTQLRGFVTVPTSPCFSETLLFKDITPSTPPSDLWIIAPVYDGQILVGFMRVPRYCADCTVTGTQKKPSFWQ